MLAKKTLKDVQVADKNVLVRVDFNVPVERGEIEDDTRIKAALPTIQYLLDHHAGVILTSHLGRPGGERVAELSLKPVAEHLGKLLDKKVIFVDDCLGAEAAEAAAALEPGEIILLENTRFYPGEKGNDPAMARKLASLADLFINDAFGTAHREHASNVGVASYLPSAAGFLLEKEIEYLDKAVEEPDRPFVAILGGAKVSGKIKVIRNLLKKTDHILIGGGMANTFFLAQGIKVGDSLVEKDAVETASEILESAGEKMMLPVDLVIAEEFSAEAKHKIIPTGDVQEGWQILDIGPETVDKFAEIIQSAGTVVWNGPMGVFEFSAFAKGTFNLTRVVAESDAVTIIGGGDSASAVRKAGLADQIDHISTGGGASLQMLQGAELPGLEALDDKS